jgi:succinate-acetate transporter protein
MAPMSNVKLSRDVEVGIPGREVSSHDRDVQVANPTYKYFEREEKLHGFLSQQFPTIANPAPLGLAAFALTTFVLSMYNTGAIVSLRSQHGVVMGLALFYGGLVQLLAGMWEFKTGNTFGALAFSSYGGFWMSFAALFIDAFGFLKPYAGTPTQDLRDCLGIYLLSWCIFSSLMTIAAHRTTVILFFLFFTVAMTFLFLSIAEFRGGDLYVQRVGGIWGIIASATAWYAAYAGLLTKKNSLFTLPVWEMDPIWRHYGILKDERPAYEK